MYNLGIILLDYIRWFDLQIYIYIYGNVRISEKKWKKESEKKKWIQEWNEESFLIFDFLWLFEFQDS